MPPRVYFTAPNIHNDANFTITIIHHVITHWSGNLPQVLYLHLDNTSRENKNQIVFGYLNMLVELGIFHKVKVGFLLVGHTHDRIDQIFTRFVVTLGRNNVGSLPSLTEVIRNAYSPERVVLRWRRSLTWRDLLWDHMVKKDALKNLITLSSNINFVSKRLIGKHLHGVRSTQNV